MKLNTGARDLTRHGGSCSSLWLAHRCSRRAECDHRNNVDEFPFFPPLNSEINMQPIFDISLSVVESLPVPSNTTRKKETEGF